MFFVFLDKVKKKEYLRLRIKENEFLIALINLSENLLKIVDRWPGLSDDDIVKTIKERLIVLKRKRDSAGDMS